MNDEELLRRYNEINGALKFLKQRGVKRNKTVDALRGAAWQLYHILRDEGYDVEEPFWR
jgi:hypothetical protein